jgi:hypothetical protein
MQLPWQQLPGLAPTPLLFAAVWVLLQLFAAQQTAADEACI